MLVLCQLVAMNTWRSREAQEMVSIAAQPGSRERHSFFFRLNRSSSQPTAILAVYRSDDLTSLPAVCLIICSLSIYFSLLSSLTFLSCLCSGSLFFCLYLSPPFFFGLTIKLQEKEGLIGFIKQQFIKWVMLPSCRVLTPSCLRVCRRPPVTRFPSKGYTSRSASCSHGAKHGPTCLEGNIESGRLCVGLVWYKYKSSFIFLEC